MAAGDETNLVKYLRCVMASVQDVENGLQQLYTDRRIDTAVGVQLDALGKLAGLKRKGLTDEPYRRRIRAKIRASQSNGMHEDLLRVTQLVLGDGQALVKVTTVGPACVTVDIIGSLTEFDVALAARDFLKLAVSAGVRLELDFHVGDPAVQFSFTGLAGIDGPGLPFGSVVDPEDGGSWAAALG
jgi:hypothetical protein